MSELMNLRGRLAVAEQAIQLLEVGIDTDIDELRSIADKYEDKHLLRVDRIALIATRLKDQVEKLRKLREQSLAIKKDLGQE
jgi:hypothetical protein